MTRTRTTTPDPERETIRVAAMEHRALRPLLRRGPYTTVNFDVPCELANNGFGGTHCVSFTFAFSGQFVRMSCTCEGEHRGAGLAMRRLGVEGSCGYALGMLRDYLLGREGESTELWQQFGGVSRAALKAARAVCSRRHDINTALGRPIEPDDAFDRPGATVLSRMFAEGMGFDAATVARFSEYAPKFVVVCDRNGLPTRAVINDKLVAKRARGVAGWMLAQAGINSTFMAVVHRARGCPVCAKHTSNPSDGVRFGFHHAGRHRAHQGGDSHRRTFELALLEVLSSLPGVGGNE